MPFEKTLQKLFGTVEIGLLQPREGGSQIKPSTFCCQN
jgi:hypothetical protein